MRDIKRIKRIMEMIEAKWNENSDERFGQLLINLGIIEDTFETWHLEDDVLEEHLKK